jgi:outer membrane protein OmpA-like peptidoglycan-associated protein
MKTNLSFWKSVTVIGMAVVLAGVSSGCVATRRFTRSRVDEKAQELSARIETNEQSIENNTNQLQAHTGQIEELNSVARDHTGKIITLDTGLQQVDQKSQQAMTVGQQAMTVGQGAQGTADNAIVQVSSLGRKFDNRNNYVVLSEETVKFKFNNTTLDESYLSMLDQLAQRIKESPDAILVMEGRTDTTGDAAYNIRLGEQRLEAVLRHLVVKQDVPMHKVYQMSFGEDKPLNENKTREERAENRAVVLRIMGPSFETQSGTAVSSATPTP